MLRNAMERSDVRMHASHPTGRNVSKLTLGKIDKTFHFKLILKSGNWCFFILMWMKAGGQLKGQRKPTQTVMEE